MKNTLRLFVLSCSLLGLSSIATTIISQVHVDYAQILSPADRQGYTITQAIVGGKVDFNGATPVFVTILTGGLSYTQPADQQGNFSFLIYPNSNQFNVSAWVAGTAKSAATVQGSFKNFK